VKAINVIKGLSIDLGAGVNAELDWSSETFGSLSSGKGINFLKEAIQKELTNRWVDFMKE
jgi:hypothetical protein